VRLALVASIVIALAGAARADDELARAHELEAKLEYEQALAIVERVLAAGDADPGRLVELHVFAGKLAAGLDRARLAEDHYARALAITPALALPDGASPKLTAPFAAAKARVQPLRVTATRERGAIAIAADDALGMVAGIAARTADGELVERHALRIAVPAGAEVREVAALDASGNRVWVGPAPVESASKPPPPPPPPPGGGEPRDTPAFYARPLTWAAVTGVALVVGGVAAWRFSADQRRWTELRDEGGHEYDELHALETRGRRWGLAANIGFGVAIAAGVTTGITWVTHLRPGPGAGVGAAVRF